MGATPLFGLHERGERGSGGDDHQPGDERLEFVVVTATTITANTKYWLAVLGPTGAGTVYFRDVSSGGRAQTSSQSNLASLPATWSSGTNYTNSPMSAYAVQQATLSAPATTTITYTYDNLYRLTNATYSTGSVFTYTYDAVGNRLTQTTITNTTVYTYDNANRMTNVGSQACARKSCQGVEALAGIGRTG